MAYTEMHCQNCGKAFFAQRFHARYCSVPCRNQAFIKRRQQRIEAKKAKRRGAKGREGKQKGGVWVKGGMLCDVCMDFFQPKRTDARYCSPRCRQAAWRERERWRFSDKKAGGG